MMYAVKENKHTGSSGDMKTTVSIFFTSYVSEALA